MADAIVSVVLEQLASVVRQEVKLVWGVGNEVKKLTSNFQTIQAVLLDAEQRQVTEPVVSVWLEKLKDVSYDMDDVLDKWNTAILQRLQIERAENAHTLKSKVCSSFLFSYSYLRRVVSHCDIAFKIKAINESVDAITKERDMYNFKIATNSIEQLQRVESTSFIDVSEVFGRDEEKNVLVGKLLCESCEERNNPHIISIVGMGGIGKTTLAQLAYNSNEVIQHFEKRIWVCVSDPFDVLRIARAILENIEVHASSLSTLESLLQKISESLRTKKFLIVLDDVWTEDYTHWEPFHHCLKNGLNGSKILVTTRKQTTADMMRSIDTIPIEKISEEQCWSLFRRLAFFGRHPDECETLEDIGRKIVSKCKGLPLAAKTMGSLLRFKSTRKEWKNILCSEMWKLEEFEKGVFTPLLLSYYDLPSKVKRCFTYCAMFPKDFHFEKDGLIKLWMAQGYLGLEHNEDMETSGEKYFNRLAMLSFFQEFEKDDDGRIMRCKMHDIVHDVAQFLSKNECCMIEDKDLREGKMNTLCEKASQLMLVITGRDTIFTSICNFKKLRSLLFQSPDLLNYLRRDVKVLPKLFDELGCLKALGIRNFCTQHIPKGIGKLIHLRYLDLSGNYELIKLPETLCELHNLQTLNLDGCDNLKELPQGIGKLINLRHLMNKGSRSLRYMPKGIERLINLRTLSEFRVCSGDYGGKACSLECLNNLPHLESLGIAGWESLRMDQIVEFKINKNIRVLRLVFNRADQRADPMKDEAILKAFQPPPDLQRLTIQRYEGHTMSGLRVTSLNKLKWIKLQLFHNCLLLPPLGKLPSLETLSIEKMTSVRAVGNEFLGVESDDDTSLSSSFISFPRLKTLKISDMWAWEVWDFGIDDRVMPSLRSLEIRNCYELKGLPKQLLQMAPLQNLFIEHCPILKQLYTKGTEEK
ncbi:hypothetical protein JRO89_XS09G0190900 [Xanthoceras sorbifolium]|uniref:Disease resistance protein RGA3 n=1 Tax=Xanthoceras sorbifolium TaxID=99658 RepID=A0ABQ8HM53_9ROSI|nr:hypothetical protein JRO89_XS09G0190900 [Xanthoceras sorbifolium]